jgi:pyruvate dehydrogenase complex dehydrogenase (E1) component
VKAVLGLRDRENANESVRLFGSGAAIPDVILVTEIIRARYKVRISIY